MPIRKISPSPDGKSTKQPPAGAVASGGGGDGEGGDGNLSPPSPSDPNRNPDGSYKVGKNRPPVNTRWKPGQSGNSRGKRKVQPDLELAVIELMEEPIVIPTAKGKTIKVTQAAALMRQSYVRAMKGDIRATKFLFEFYAKAKASQATVGGSQNTLSAAEQEMLKALFKGMDPDDSTGDAS